MGPALSESCSSSGGRRLELRPLWRAGGLALLASRWQRGRHPDSSESATSWAVVELMRRGSYRKHGVNRADTGPVVGDANHAVLFRPGERFAIEHPVGTHNEGLSLRIAPELWREWTGEHRAPEDERHPLGSLALPGIDRLPVPARIHLSAARLVRCFEAARRGDDLEIEETLFGWLEQLAECASVKAGPQLGRLRGAYPRSERGARERVVAAQEILGGSLDQPLPLRELARRVDLSPWHLARLFRRHAGVSPHRYRSRLRLRACLAALEQPRGDLTELALAHGFSSHSHFSAAFRNEFGVTPTAARAARDGSPRDER